MITSSDLRELADRSLSGDAPSSMSEPFRNWLGMGATIPARIQPGSIDHVPFPTVVPCLGASLALREKARRRKSLSLPVPDHIPVRPQKRKSQCLLLSRRSLEWECSVGKVSGRQRGSQTGLLSAAKLICAGESQVPEVSSIRPGAWIPHNE